MFQFAKFPVTLCELLLPFIPGMFSPSGPEPEQHLHKVDQTSISTEAGKGDHACRQIVPQTV